MKVVPLTEQLLRSIELREIDRAELGDDIENCMEYLMSATYKRAVLDGEKVVMALGGHVVGNTCRTWVLGTDLMEKKPITSIKYIMDVEAAFMENFSTKIFYTYNLPDYPHVLKYLDRIGYRQIKTETGFSDNRDRILLVKELTHGS